MLKKILATITFLGGLSLPVQASQFMGMNTNEVTNFNASVPFADLFKLADPFQHSPGHLTQGNVQYDANGWVKHLNGGQAGTYFLRWMPAETLPKGEYTVTYEGEGVLTYAESAELVRREEGRDIIKLVPKKNNEYNASLVVKRSNPANPIRHIRVLLPGGICGNNVFKRVDAAAACPGSYKAFADHPDELTFNPDYLNFMRPFKTIRFMNMSGITRNPIRSWQQRPQVQEASWGGKEGQRGAPVEVMIKLANTLNANPWFNMPHQADDTYVREFAQLVKQQLKPGLKAHIEYTNEIWNNVFSQSKYVKDMGIKNRLDPSRDMAGYKYYSIRSKQIFQIWEQVFGGSQRLVRVLSGWSGHPGITPHLLKTADVYKHTDLFAIAPYFYASQQEMMQAKNMDDIFRFINDPKQRYSIPKTLELIKKHAELIRPYKVRLAAYEGGQHLVHYGIKSKFQHPNPILMDANRDPRMETAYVQLINGFKQQGGVLFMAFSAPRANAFWGSWGVKEYLNQPDAETPKYRAIMKF
jgi:2-keto-3-deoxy-6-phosphogluconate aldolase